MADESALHRASSVLLALLPLALWCSWFLWGVNWNKLRPVLAAGAWAPVVLLMLIVAGVWSRMMPSECPCLGFVVLANFWWQLGAMAMLVGLAQFCGWLQTTLHWAPAEIDLEPPAHHAHHDGHDHGHAHH